jgi:hypothetical protein
MHQKQLESVVNLSDEERYGYFIRKVCDVELVWSLNNEGWATSADNKGNIVLPFWPEQEFAALCATDNWKGYLPTSISLDEFLSEWLPGMDEDSSQASIFPVPGSSRSVIIDPKMLLSHIREELLQYE